MQSMQLTKEQLQDEIFELEMELKELKTCLSVVEKCVDEDCPMSVFRDIKELTKDIQETMCYISYYKVELQDLEDLKYE